MLDSNISPDALTIKQHLQHITGRWSEFSEECLLELVILSADDRAIVRQVNHYEINQLDLATDDAESWSKTGANVYATVNPVSKVNRPPAHKRAKAENILGSFFHWADADDAQAAQNIKNFVGPQSTFYTITGTKPCVRPHVYWELQEFTRDTKAWSQTQRAIAATLGTDPAVVDPPRIMRLAGTVNWPKPQKTEKGYIPELVTLHIYQQSERPLVSSDRMARAFPSIRPAVDEDGLPPMQQDGKGASEFLDILNRAKTDGQKHGGVRDLAASLAGQGVNKAMAEAIIRQSTPVWDDNVEDLINSAYSKFYQPNPEPVINTDKEPAPEIAKLLEWADDVEPALTDAYLVKGVLSAGAMSVIYGPSNSGKTFFALDLAYRAAVGGTWRGRRIAPVSVLYLAAEGGRGIANRIVAMRNALGVSGIPFALRRAGMDLLQSEADLQAIYDLAKEVKAAGGDRELLVVIDTLSRVMAGGDENSAADMTALIRNIDAIREATSAHIMLVHHTGKDTARGARGHSSLRAATDTEIEVQSEDESRAAIVTKQRDYSGGETFAFNLKSITLGVDQDGDEVTTCLVEEADSEEFKATKKASKGRGKNQTLIMETFDQMIGEGMGTKNPGGVGMPEAGQFWAVDLHELRRIAQAKMVGDNAAKLFRQAWDALTGRDGLFCTGDNLAWRIDRRIK